MPDDTFYVSLSRQSDVDSENGRRDTVGFCVPCCRDCLSFWRKKYVKHVIFAVLFFLVELLLMFFAGKHSFFLPIVIGIVGGIVLCVFWLVRFRAPFSGGLIEALDHPWISELTGNGYSINVIYPRHAKSRDMKEENGEKSYYLGHGRRERRYYTWKGCVNFYHERMLNEGSPARSRTIFSWVWPACLLFVLISVPLAIWIGYLVLIAYLYLGNGHQGETSFFPVIMALALAIGLTYGFARLVLWLLDR